MQREAMFHGGIYLGFNGEAHHLNFRKLVGKGITIYGQQEVVKDLVARRLADGGQILFEVEDVTVHDFETRQADHHASATRAKREASIAISSPAATAFTASAGRAFRQAC